MKPGAYPKYTMWGQGFRLRDILPGISGHNKFS